MSTGSVAFVGLANSACSSFLTALGLVLQQAARSADAAARATDGGAAWKAKRGTYTATSLQVPCDQPGYLAGLGCVLLGALGSFACDGMLPQSTLAPLTCQIIVYKIVLGRAVLGEPVPGTTVLALAVMVAGMVVSLCGAPLADQSYNLNKLLGLFEAPPALALTCLAGLALLGLRRLLKHAYDNKFGNFVGLGYLALAAGLIAGWSGALSKAIVELMLTALSRESSGNDFRHPGTYLLLLLAPYLVSIKLKYVSVGLAHFPVDTFMPLYQAVVVTCNALCGIVYYTDFAPSYDPAAGQGQSGGNLPVFLTGTAMAVVGVLLLLRPPSVGPADSGGVIGGGGGGSGGAADVAAKLAGAGGRPMPGQAGGQNPPGSGYGSAPGGRGYASGAHSDNGDVEDAGDFDGAEFGSEYAVVRGNGGGGGGGGGYRGLGLDGGLGGGGGKSGGGAAAAGFRSMAYVASGLPGLGLALVGSNAGGGGGYGGGEGYGPVPYSAADRAEFDESGFSEMQPHPMGGGAGWEVNAIEL